MAIWRIPITITDPRAGVCVNVWHGRTVGPDSASETTQLNNMVGALRTFYLARGGDYPNTCRITADFAVEQQEGRDKPLTWASITGSGLGASAPPHLAVCVNLKTSIRGRRARGRIFLGPGMTVNIDNDGSIKDQWLTDIRANLDTLRGSSVADAGWALGVWGLQSAAPQGYWRNGGTGKELPHVLRDVTSFQVNDRYAVMRSRKPKG